MRKIVVLGGCGGIGSVAARTLAVLKAFDEIVIADIRAAMAAKTASCIGSTGVTSAEVDATSAESLASVIKGADVVLNCIGPFYRFGPPVLEAAIGAQVDYVDVCDDLDPTKAMLEMDEAAKEAGVRALVGMGNSPGLANVFVRLCQDVLLDQVEEVDIMHAHGGEHEEGPAVVKHRIHAMVNDVPLFIDGKFIAVRQLEPSAQPFVVETEFRNVGTYPVYPYPHPETITLPKHIPGLRRATNRGVIFPLEYFQLVQDMVRVGACAREPLKVKGQDVVPLDFSVAHILRQRDELLRRAGVKGPAGCLKVVVAGTKAGKRQTLVFQLSSTEAGAGEGTGIPAAVGAVLMKEDKLGDAGVYSPEAAANPLEVMSLGLQAAKMLGTADQDNIHVESIDETGERTTLALSL